MYLTGFFNKFYGYCISAKIFFIELGKEQQILFKIDSGCDITTISFIDSLMLNLNYDELQNIETLTAGGELANSIIINNCALGFIVNNESIHFEILNNIHISRPVLNPANINYNKKLGLHLSLPSLLGLDVLRRYKVSYFNNVVYLEK